MRKIILVLLAVFISLGIASPKKIEASDNFYYNESFENYSLGSIYSQGWVRDNAGNGGTIVSDYAQDGDYSILFDGWEMAHLSSVNVPAGSNSFSFWWREETAYSGYQTDYFRIYVPILLTNSGITSLGIRLLREPSTSCIGIGFDSEVTDAIVSNCQAATQWNYIEVSFDFENRTYSYRLNPQDSFTLVGTFWNLSSVTGFASYPFCLYNMGWPNTRFWFDNFGSSTPTYNFPLSGSLENRTILLEFGDTWTFGECPTGIYKKHAGIDLNATEDEEVYAAHDGTVKAIYTGQHAQWADAIVIENDNQEHTTVYWHVIKYGNLAVNDHVTKGQQIATIADLGTNTHFHFGFRSGSYDSSLSLAGALPEEDCGGYLAFPENFLDPSQLTYE